MADHPANTPPPSSTVASKPKPPPTNLPPPPSAYVVRIPREQVLRHPPPENAKRYEKLRHGKNRRSCCCRCCCFTFCLLLLLIAAAAAAAGVMYFVFGFKSPSYAVTNVSIEGLNLTSAAPISPRFDVSIRAENPNGKVGIYYSEHSTVDVFYDGVRLGDGVLPRFFQPRRNVTVMRTTVTGTDVDLDGAVRTTLRSAQSRGKVPLVVNVQAPVRLKVGSVKTWEITVKVKCDVVLDSLSDKAKIVSKNCDYSVRLW